MVKDVETEENDFIPLDTAWDYVAEGFVNRFTQRHGIRKLKYVGEKASADKSAVESFTHQFREMIQENFTREQIYNTDKTGLCWRAIPTTTLAGLEANKIEGLKLDKDRVTLMACPNSMGTDKLDLLFIYKYENPRVLKHVDKKKLPDKYYSQSKAWMNITIFDDWFNNEFIPVVRKYLRSIGLEEKAVLVLDNALAHVKFHKEGRVRQGKDYTIWCVFLPTNTTSVIQPVDQGVLDTVKRYYRKKLMRSVLCEINEKKAIIEVKKSITIRDAIHWAAEAWLDVVPILFMQAGITSYHLITNGMRKSLSQLQVRTKISRYRCG